MSYDYVIVGAGSAGCVLANRLGADTSGRIAVIEAGPPDRDLMIHIPAGVHSVWQKPSLNWNDHSAPEPAAEGRQVFMPRGRVLGGSSSINSMVYMRGHPLDFDGWAQAPGMGAWSYAQCLPYFRAGESYAGGGDAYRGDGGELSTVRSSYDNPLYDAFLEGGAQAGFTAASDLNGATPEGVARFDATKRNGRRCSAAVAHLRPALRRGNVDLMTHTQVRRVILNGDTATGVEVLRQGRVERIEADQVILSGGALNSPQLLMLSGIGPADHLADMGVETRVDLPGVGSNLMDHATVIVEVASLKHFPIHAIANPLRKGLAGLRWVFTRDGLAASNIWEAGGLIRADDRTDRPNVQYHVAPVGFGYEAGKIVLSQAFAVHVDLLHPHSRGTVRLASNDPMQRPVLQFNYLSQQADIQVLIDGVRALRRIVSQPAYAGLAGAELTPGPEVQTDADLTAWIRRAVETDFHPCGTCRMGTGSDAVVDPEMRVHGVRNLRVVDASVMPRITGGNLNAPTQMIAARAADMVRSQTA